MKYIISASNCIIRYIISVLLPLFHQYTTDANSSSIRSLASYQRKKLKESKQEDWTTTKQVNEMMVKDGRVRYHHHIYIIYTLLHKWGFKQAESYQGRYMLIQILEKRKKDSKKNEGNIIRQPC